MSAVVVGSQFMRKGRVMLPIGSDAAEPVGECDKEDECLLKV
jgi:hypothetical protein